MTTDIVQLKEKGKPVYLKTHTAAIDGLESYIKKIDADKAYQKITKKEPLWTGAWYGGAAGNGQVPSKSLSQCENGWILQWQEYTKEGALNGACCLNSMRRIQVLGELFSFYMDTILI